MRVLLDVWTATGGRAPRGDPKLASLEIPETISRRRNTTGSQDFRKISALARSVEVCHCIRDPDDVSRKRAEGYEKKKRAGSEDSTGAPGRVSMTATGEAQYGVLDRLVGESGLSPGGFFGRVCGGVKTVAETEAELGDEL